MQSVYSKAPAECLDLFKRFYQQFGGEWAKPYQQTDVRKKNMGMEKS